MMSDFWLTLYREVLPVLLQLLAVLVSFALVRLSDIAHRRWGIEIEARHREALQSALMSGISAALSRGLRGDAAVEAALAYTRRSVPDALKKLQPDDTLLRDLVAAKLHQAPPWIGIDLARGAVGGGQ